MVPSFSIHLSLCSTGFHRFPGYYEEIRLLHGRRPVVVAFSESTARADPCRPPWVRTLDIPPLPPPYYRPGLGWIWGVAFEDTLTRPVRLAWEPHIQTAPVRAIDCTNLTDLVEAFVQAGIAPATRRAYRSDLDHFFGWGGTIPASDAEVAAYVAAHAEVLKVATLNRRLAAISVAHDAQGHPSPVGPPLVRATMRGIRRERGVAQRRARPLLSEDLFAVLAPRWATA
ncbi:hypothetical protein GGD83_004785 [Rhodoblastus sphagnicola]|uniref:site-specific integrase n=1 Tax=Rhodoblastus sphagnicola TaxID=333368 RepID=UPI0017B0E99C|nr:site-specific integrase [Rhodoblastus sphagnicola]MBB4200956.1 hypothetical protein [Rhodoblastus sphagnicola]